MATYLYTKADVDVVEAYFAPDQSSLSDSYFGGAYLGQVTARVKGVTDSYTYIEFLRDNQQKWYVLESAAVEELPVKAATLEEAKKSSGTGSTSPSSGNNGTSFWDKVVGIATGIFGIFQGSKDITGTGTSTGTDNSSDGGNSEDNSNADQGGGNNSTVLDFLKKNIIWLLPTVVLVPILIFWGLKKLLKKDGKEENSNSRFDQQGSI